MRNTPTNLPYWVSDFVYGGLDGVITTFAVVAGVVGAGLPVSVILIMGGANLFADGFSMSTGRYMSGQSENEIIKRLKKNDAKKGGRRLYVEDGMLSPFKAALVTFVAFVVVGAIPLLPYFYHYFNPLSTSGIFWLTVAATLTALFIVGLIKGWALGEHTIKSAVTAVLIGGLAATVAYYVGFWIHNVLLINGVV